MPACGASQFFIPIYILRACVLCARTCFLKVRWHITHENKAVSCKNHGLDLGGSTNGFKTMPKCTLLGSLRRNAFRHYREEGGGGGGGGEGGENCGLADFRIYR